MKVEIRAAAEPSGDVEGESSGVTLIFIYGPPAVGKLTVAKELARSTGFPLFHNHMAFDLASSLFRFGTRGRQYDLFTPVPFRESLSLDTSRTTPQQAALEIARRFDLPGERTNDG